MLKQCFSGGIHEAGCDEAGRGCLAGPVFAASVILPIGYSNEYLQDSKKLNRQQRENLREIIEKDALAWAVEAVDNLTIDKINILNASILAMHKAIHKLKCTPQLLLIDGNRFHPFAGIPHKCIVKGDSMYQSIAAASILAKTYRDDFMASIHKEFPHYEWEENKGYATASHRKAILEYGISQYHRRSFNLGWQLKLEFK